jgi:hypothetical protein
LYGTLEREKVIVGLGGSVSSDMDSLRGDGLGDEAGPEEGAGGGGISLYARDLRDLGDSDLVREAEPDVDGREMEAVGEGGAMERTGELRESDGDGERGATWRFPGRASGELVEGVK